MMKSPVRPSSPKPLENDVWGECGISGKDLLRRGYRGPAVATRNLVGNTIRVVVDYNKSL